MDAFQRAMRQIEIWEHDYQLQEAKARKQAPQQPVEQPDGEEQPAKKLCFSAPAPVHMSFSSGSVDGIVQRMAEPQNISRAAAFLAEGLIFWDGSQISVEQTRG